MLFSRFSQFGRRKSEEFQSWNNHSEFQGMQRWGRWAQGLVWWGRVPCQALPLPWLQRKEPAKHGQGRTLCLPGAAQCILCFRE